MGNSRMLHGLVAIVVVVGLAAGCGGGKGLVKVATPAVDDLARAKGVQSKVLELNPSQVERLAGTANVSTDLIGEVAPTLQSRSIWSRSVSSVERMRSVVGDENADYASDVALGVACDVINGKITNDQEFWDSIFGKLQGLTQNEMQAVYESTVSFWQDLYDAMNSGNPESRATAVVTCYVIDQL